MSNKMVSDIPQRERYFANIQSLRDLAIFLEGYKLGKGNLLPLGTICLDDLWNTIRELNSEGVVYSSPEFIKSINTK